MTRTAKQFFQEALPGFYYVNYFKPNEDLAFYKRADGRIVLCHVNVSWQVLAPDQYPSITLQKLKGSVYDMSYPGALGRARHTDMLSNMLLSDPSKEG